MRKITKHSMMLKEPVYMRNKTEYAQKERESERVRERGTKRYILLRMQHLEQPNLYKRLQSHFI